MRCSNVFAFALCARFDPRFVVLLWIALGTFRALRAACDGLRPFCKAGFEIPADPTELAFGDHRAHLGIGIEPRTHLDLLIDETLSR